MVKANARKSFMSRLPAANTAPETDDPDEFIGSQAHTQFLADVAELRELILSPRRKTEKSTSLIVDVQMKENGPILREQIDQSTPLAIGLQGRMTGGPEGYHVYDAVTGKRLDMSKSLAALGLLKNPKLLLISIRRRKSSEDSSVLGSLVSLSISLNGDDSPLEMFYANTADRILRSFDLSPSNAKVLDGSGNEINLNATLGELRVRNGAKFVISQF